MKQPIIYIDNKYIKATKQLLDVFTPGKQKIHGVFETLRVVNGTIEYPDEHLARLSKGLKFLKIKPSHSISQLKTIISQVVKKNPSYEYARLRIVVFSEKTTTHIVVMILKYQPYSDRIYNKGLKSTLIKTERIASSRFADTKSLDYTLFANAFEKAKENGFEEAILTNKKGHIFETSRGNIFISYKDQWLTPPLSSGCLNGIMRQKMISTFRGTPLEIHEKTITPAMLKQAEKIIMTNSLVGMIELYF